MTQPKAGPRGNHSSLVPRKLDGALQTACRQGKAAVLLRKSFLPVTGSKANANSSPSFWIANSRNWQGEPKQLKGVPINPLPTQRRHDTWYWSEMSSTPGFRPADPGTCRGVEFHQQ